MHNCKATKEYVAERLLSGIEDRPEELLECSDCCSEFDALKAALRVTSRLIEQTTPPPNYWTGYHLRLRNRLVNESATEAELRNPSWPTRFMTSSFRVPMPVAAALLVVVGVGVLFLYQASEKRVTAPTVSVVEVPVQVPVVQERIITRVVYRYPKSHVARRSLQDTSSSVFARSQQVNPVSLIGFKPLDKVNITVIKGGVPDEK